MKRRTVIIIVTAITLIECCRLAYDGVKFMAETGIFEVCEDEDMLKRLCKSYLETETDHASVNE